MEFKKICIGCLSNDSLKGYIKQKSKTRIRECPICNSKNKIAIDITDLAYYMEDCIMKNYSALEAMDGIDYDQENDIFYYVDTEEPVEFTTISQIIEDNNVFSNIVTNYSHEKLCEAIFNSINSNIGIYEYLAEKGWVHAYSNDLFYTWERLNYLVQHNNRFFEDHNNNRSDCLSKIIDRMCCYEEIIPKGTILYRVRKVNNYLDGVFSNHMLALKEISPPPCEYTKSYRMSPRGISYTYLSTDIKTCLKECSVKVKNIVFIGTFETKKI